MKQAVLLDTGPLVALVNRREQFHKWVTNQFGQIEPPLLTCEAVVTEACFLLQNSHFCTRPLANTYLFAHWAENAIAPCSVSAYFCFRD
ncbi:hypothetical protein [Nostoc sp.]|uniref:hypothetical protein n=1 Tax=Nostoc sp. TaxID=1180 RepID=UPI002FF91B47